MIALKKNIKKQSEEDEDEGRDFISQVSQKKSDGNKKALRVTKTTVKPKSVSKLKTKAKTKTKPDSKSKIKTAAKSKPAKKRKK